MNAPVSAVAGLPRMLLKAEGFALFAICVFAYWKLGVTWWLFAVLILAPDLTMMGYLAGPRFGAHLYNAGHITVMPLILGFARPLHGLCRGNGRGIGMARAYRH
jgi:hypothetical protein